MIVDVCRCLAQINAIEAFWAGVLYTTTISYIPKYARSGGDGFHSSWGSVFGWLLVLS